LRIRDTIAPPTINLDNPSWKNGKRLRIPKVAWRKARYQRRAVELRLGSSEPTHPLIRASRVIN